MFNISQEEIMKNWIPTEDGNPIVSIRCLAYNHEKYIRRMLDSMLMQKTNFPFQIVIHDDASTDNTAEIIKEYAEKYPKVILPLYEEENQNSKKDGSLTRAITPYITGKYVCWLEGDDFWIDDHKLQKQFEFFCSHPEFSLIGSRRIKVDEDDYILPYKHYDKDIMIQGDDVLRINEMIHVSTWMHKNFFGDDLLMKKLQQFLDAKAVGDWTYLLFLADCGNIYISNDNYSARRVILRNDADNYNSIMRYKTNKFDVIKNVMKSEYNMSKVNFERLNYRFKPIKNLSIFYFNYLLSNKDNREYAKKVFKENYVPVTTKAQRIIACFCLYKPVLDILKTKMFALVSKIETKNEIGKKI